MRHAKYEMLENGTYAGYIPECPGVWADEDTIDECRNTLEEVLEEWIILGLEEHDRFPEIDGIKLNTSYSTIDA